MDTALFPRATKMVASVLVAMMVIVGLSLVASAQPASAITHLPNGTTFRSASRGVYLVANGHVYGIPNPETLNRCFGGFGRVQTYSEAVVSDVLATYPHASSPAACYVAYPNGTMLQAPGDPKVYVILNGRRYWVASPSTVTGCLGGWGNLRQVSAAELAWTNDFYPYSGLYDCPAASIGVREQRAIAWSQTQLRNTRWNGWCELFVEQAFGRSGQYASALAHANSQIARGRMQRGNRNVPAGALAFFGAHSSNGGYGHVMISIGNGQFITSGYNASGVYVTTLSGIGGAPYIGWSWANDGWSR